MSAELPKFLAESLYLVKGLTVLSLKYDKYDMNHNL